MEQILSNWCSLLVLLLGLRLSSIEHGRIGIGPQDLFVLGDNGSPDYLILMVDFELVVLVDHGLEELADVVGVES